MLDYYKETYNINEDQVYAMVCAYVSKYPSEITKLTGIAMDAQSRKNNKLRDTQGVLLDNHLFLYDLLNNCEDSVQDSLRTKYTKIPDGLIFKDQKILDLLKEK